MHMFFSHPSLYLFLPSSFNLHSFSVLFFFVYWSKEILVINLRNLVGITLFMAMMQLSYIYILILTSLIWLSWSVIDIGLRKGSADLFYGMMAQGISCLYYLIILHIYSISCYNLKIRTGWCDRRCGAMQLRTWGFNTQSAPHF